MKEPYEKPKLITQEFSTQVFLAACAPTVNNTILAFGNLVCVLAINCKCTVTRVIPQY
jgi:hypothetical protein